MNTFYSPKNSTSKYYFWEEKKYLFYCGIAIITSFNEFIDIIQCRNAASSTSIQLISIDFQAQQAKAVYNSSYNDECDNSEDECLFT